MDPPYSTLLLFLINIIIILHPMLTATVMAKEHPPDFDSREEDLLSRPHSVSVALVTWYPPVVRVQWLYGSPTRIRFSPGSRPSHEPQVSTLTCTSAHRLHKFELSYRARGDSYRLVLDLPAETRSTLLEDLRAGAEYDLYLSAVSDLGLHNKSHAIRFFAPKTENGSSPGPLSYQPPGGHSLTVREEEVIIVVLVLVVWVAVIFLFFNKWGKIRMLEPYQPQYRDPPPFQTLPKAPRVSVGGGAMESLLERDRFSPVPAYNLSTPRGAFRPRQNSVFVGSPYMYSRPSIAPGGVWSMPRKYKSAEDIKSLVVQITQCDVETGDNEVETSVV